MMANSARDPLFLAALTVANQDTAGIGEWCLRCHAPAAHVRGRATSADTTGFDMTDLQGVGCDVCHRAEGSSGADPGVPYIGNAQLSWGTTATKFGPYFDSFSPGHPTAGSSYITDSKLCGACHEVSNPVVNMVNEAGSDLGVGFPLDTTYTEWKNSKFSKTGPEQQSCQDCHMSRHDQDAEVCNVPGAVVRPKPATHYFIGGNLWGVQAVEAADEAFSMPLAAAFAEVKTRTESLVKTAASIEILQVPSGTSAGTPIDVTVRVTNRTGHKFPTGYADGRRAWVQVEWTPPGGDPEVLIGAYDPLSGAIQADPPPRVYAATHAERLSDGTLVYDHLSRHNLIERDTRIPPEGFLETGTTKPKGINFADGAGGWHHYDDWALLIPGQMEGVHQLRVRLYFQSVTSHYVDFLNGENTTDARGSDLKQIFDGTGRGAPILIDQAVTDVTITAAPGPDAGGPDAGPDATTDAGVDASSEAGPPADASVDAPVEGGGGTPDEDGGCGCIAAGASGRSASWWQNLVHATAPALGRSDR